MLTLSSQENGVETAIQCIYRDMEYAKNLIKRKAGKNKNAAIAAASASADSDAEDEEESWTFVGGDEPDPDMTTKRLSEMHAAPGKGELPGASRGLGNGARGEDAAPQGPTTQALA